jgi:hypothetical protein
VRLVSDQETKDLLEALRAQVTVQWELLQRMDRILRLFERPADDPRSAPDLYRPRY